MILDCFFPGRSIVSCMFDSELPRGTFSSYSFCGNWTCKLVSLDFQASQRSTYCSDI